MSFPEHGDRPVVAARAWLFSAEAERAPATSREVTRDRRSRVRSRERFFDGLDPSWGYGPSIEWRFVAGGFHEVGDAQVWAAVRVPLVREEPTSDLQRMLVVADSTNGISAALPMRPVAVHPALAHRRHTSPAGGRVVHARRAQSIEAQGNGVARSTIATSTATAPTCFSHSSSPRSRRWLGSVSRRPLAQLRFDRIGSVTGPIVALTLARQAQHAAPHTPSTSAPTSHPHLHGGERP